jgi:hypothetical protein
MQTGVNQPRPARGLRKEGTHIRHMMQHIHHHDGPQLRIAQRQPSFIEH